MEKKEFKFNLGDMVSHKAETDYSKDKMMVISRAFIETPYGYEEEYMLRVANMGSISTVRMHAFELETYNKK